MRRHLSPGLRAIVLLRDGNAVSALAQWLISVGFAKTRLTIMEALGGPQERLRVVRCDTVPEDIRHPVCVALEIKGDGAVIPRASGWQDSFFENDGQITRRPVRALALSALAPRPGEHLWDIGSGSGSIAIEWMLSHPQMRATAIEARTDSAARIRRNADNLGADRLALVTGTAPATLANLETPDAVFIGGGLSEEMLQHLHAALPARTRLVSHAVTLESDALLSSWQSRLGGELMRIDLASAAPLGKKRGWRSAFPIVQWSVQL